MTSKNVFNKKFDSIYVKNSEIFQVLKSEKNCLRGEKRLAQQHDLVFKNEKT